MLFRPIGQNIFYSVLKVAIDKNKQNDAITFFAHNDFSLSNPIWKRVFTNIETDRIKTDKTIQKFVTQIILKNIGVNIRLTEKNNEIHQKYGIDPNSLETIQK